MTDQGRTFRARDRSQKIDRLTPKPAVPIPKSGTIPDTLEYAGDSQLFSHFFRKNLVHTLV
jgi:hypothetical protein